MDTLTVTLIPCLRDNYAYLLTSRATNEAAVVDPSEAGPVIAAVEAAGVDLVCVLNTHHHWDHTGGNKGLLARWPALGVYGFQSDEGRIPGQTVSLSDGDRVHFADQSADVKHIPGHTTGAVAYCFPGRVFTGDTLFFAGCGRLFEGTPEMMHRSIQRLVDELPPETEVYSGHEYTVSNLRFAAAAEPGNADIVTQLSWAEAERAAGRPTMPSTLELERRVNPFVRAASAEHFGELRSWKDGF